jgi:hypothetical protein
MIAFSAQSADILTVIGELGRRSFGGRDRTPTTNRPTEPPDVETF